MSDYESWQAFAASWGSLYFALIFVIGCRLRALAVAQARCIDEAALHAFEGGLIMSDGAHPNIDAHTGTATTGHEWDGIKELNTPLPRWWLWTLLRLHRLGGRLLGRLSRLAAGLRLDRGLARLALARGDRAGHRRS